jgi:ABC-2 type transport system ATP-binding protein
MSRNRKGRVAAASDGTGASGASVVSFENVSKHYGHLRAVDGLTLDVRHGETVALLGGNGSGKSTSLDMVLGLRKPTGGRITVFGSAPSYAVKAGRVGAMLQSGGLTQQVRRALAICGQSELIVLDEPTAAMDTQTRRLFWSSLKEEVTPRRTVLFATRDLEEADQAADRIAIINRGRLVADGTPAEIKARAGARQLSFRLDRVDMPLLLGLPGLTNLEVRNDVVQIQSTDSDATLYALLDAGLRPRELEVTVVDLEQAILAITAEDDSVSGGRQAG